MLCRHSHAASGKVSTVRRGRASFSSLRKGESRPVKFGQGGNPPWK